MKSYWIKTHFLFKRIFGQYIWDLPTPTKTVYLTFDDGPTPEITEWVLAQLEKHNAKATFFCIGQNIENHPDIFKKTVAAGHSIGNHTFDHLNGWKTKTALYLENVAKCRQTMAANNVATSLFRPPYAKVKRAQWKALTREYKIIMWDVLSADFDQTITPEKCMDNVLKHINPGSIIIFHDSIKASENMRYALPKTLEYLSENGYQCAAITNDKRWD